MLETRSQLGTGSVGERFGTEHDQGISLLRALPPGSAGDSEESGETTKRCGGGESGEDASDYPATPTLCSHSPGSLVRRAIP